MKRSEFSDFLVILMNSFASGKRKLYNFLIYLKISTTKIKVLKNFNALIYYFEQNFDFIT